MRVDAENDDAEDLGTAQSSLPSDQVLTEVGAGTRAIWPKQRTTTKSYQAAA